MKQLMILAAVVAFAVPVFADTFGTGNNQFTIDFVTISGDASSANGVNIGDQKPEGFIDPSEDYRMGTYEITNDQWAKFKAAYGAITGTPMNAYDQDPYWTGSNVPTNEVSWYEAAQFVNYLNTSKGYQAAYKFTGTQGTSNYALGVWQVGDTGFNSSNPYRNSNAFYFLPSENEWVKAAYWNGSALQTHATKADESLYQGKGSNGGWNYMYNNQYATNPYGPWVVGSGSQELNGTYDMMGNVREWMESPYVTGDYLSYSIRCIRGGSYNLGDISLSSSNRRRSVPDNESDGIGFRVASIPEPCTLLLLGLGGVMLRKR